MNPKVDIYLSEGCGRCPLGGTPDCKVNNWREELEHLRQTVLDCGLKEELKWGVPCYTYKNKNVAIVSALKGYCAISFFKGVLLKDKQGLLEKPGENTQADRLVKITGKEQIIKLEQAIKDLIREAIEIEKAGKKFSYEKNPEPIPSELIQKFEDNPALKTAFESLTLGRQRGYILHFSQPKQSKTRATRIEKCMPKIFAGKGFHEY